MDGDPERGNRAWPLGSNLLLENYRSVVTFLPKPRLVVYMNRQDFRQFVCRLAILSMYFVYKVDGVRHLGQMTCHLVQPMVLMNFAAALGLEVRSTSSHRWGQATKEEVYQSLVNQTD